MFVKMNIQLEAQPTQITAPNFSVPPPQVNVDLSHQQAEIKTGQHRSHSNGQLKVHASTNNPQHPTTKIDLTQVQVGPTSARFFGSVKICLAYQLSGLPALICIKLIKLYKN